METKLRITSFYQQTKKKRLSENKPRNLLIPSFAGGGSVLKRAERRLTVRELGKREILGAAQKFWKTNKTEDRATSRATKVFVL